MGTRPTDARQILAFSWDEMDRLHRKVARKIAATGYVPEVIVGILRCGQVPSIHLSYILGVREVASIAVRSFASDAPLAERVPPEVKLNVPPGYLAGKRVLLVDAVMESGTTAELCISEIRKHHRPTDIKLAMITDWYNSTYKIAFGKRPAIDFVGTRVTKWPDFPWEH
jgi:hypoxanthine phosphoribosyltransferase